MTSYVLVILFASSASLSKLSVQMKASMHLVKLSAPVFSFDSLLSKLNHCLNVC